MAEMANKEIDPNKVWQIGIKGLVFDEAGKLMLIQEENGKWELPGGRIEHGESIVETLKREVKEEMEVECEVLDTSPYWAWPEQFTDFGWWRMLLCYRIKLSSFDFITTEECIGYDFFDARELEQLEDKLYTPKIIDFLSEQQG